LIFGLLYEKELSVKKIGVGVKGYDGFKIAIRIGIDSS